MRVKSTILGKGGKDDFQGDRRSIWDFRRTCGSIEFNAYSVRQWRLPMLDLERDIHPLTDFKRNTSEFLKLLRETGGPIVLTINGKAEIVVQDAKSYQRLLDLAERLETIEAVREGLQSADRGEGRPMEAVFDDLEKALRSSGQE